MISGKVENVNLHAIDYHVGLIGSGAAPGCGAKVVWLQWSLPVAGATVCGANLGAPTKILRRVKLRLRNDHQLDQTPSSSELAHLSSNFLLHNRLAVDFV